jgi:hypothetical protein
VHDAAPTGLRLRMQENMIIITKALVISQLDSNVDLSSAITQTESSAQGHQCQPMKICCLNPNFNNGLRNLLNKAHATGCLAKASLNDAKLIGCNDCYWLIIAHMSITCMLPAMARPLTSRLHH